MKKTKITVTFQVESEKRPTRAWLAAFRKRLLVYPSEKDRNQTGPIIDAGWNADIDSRIGLDYVYAEADPEEGRPNTLKVKLG